MNPTKLLDHVIAPAPRYILRLSILQTIFARHLPKHDYSSIEFGPGLGDVSRYLAHDPLCKELTLVDFSQETLDMLRERFEDPHTIRFICDELANMPSTKTYDVVLAFEVLEHIEEDAQAIEKLFSLTKPAGQFIMSVPAYQRKWQKQDVNAGHVRRYERADLQSKLANAGFDSIHIIDYGFPLTALMYPFRQTLYKPDTNSSLQERSKKSGITRPFFARFPLWLLYPFYLPFIAMQKLFADKDLGDGFIAIAKKP